MFARRIDRLTSSLVRDILAAATRPDMISFAGGLPAEEALYQPTLNDGKLPDIWQYGQTEGEPRLRELVAQHARALGIDCTAAQVLIVNGSQQGIDLVSKLFIDEGTPLLTEAPAYLAALQSFRLFGAELHSFAVDADGAQLDQLKAQLVPQRCVYLTPTFQNPSGYCYSDAERNAVAGAVDAADAILFEDDPYRDLAYDGPAPAPIAGRLQRARWIYQGSFSKTLAPGLRLGYLIVHPDFITPLTRLKQAADLHSNRLSQALVADCLERGALATHVQSVLPLYLARRDAMAAALQQHLAEYAEWALPKGGLFFWLRLKQRVDTRQLLQAGLDAGIAIMPGDAFFAGTPQQSCLRLNFSHANPALIETGVQRLAGLLAQANRLAA
ncbi:DNA-binding transcriptional regulator, MocR family, contains an aminotransferase domain [Andreprevotia lacus DSM 23236]|jgi:DNA-binding transcriptional MocR family regulator|uniref:Putative 8-amino-7-oxononanoate synthase n=1 Tax=Andreprevotia lacus DSM 23236 TaxID=1121001 RepID=A0A1W1XMV4_9NEIS|nr:PLP-dependent aminotransferase family protein [Andreprevotia lacus]SMC25310.1 DNA-binding transcriptional regulator, MocR family, contains an aminotransferase domain [Andreprevotia lacus DSM 23236]